MAKKLRKPEYRRSRGDHVGALSIEHFVYIIAGDKLGALIRVIEVENPEGAVIFCNTKDETERVAQALTRQGYDADWLNGDLPQSDRERRDVEDPRGASCASWWRPTWRPAASTSRTSPT